MPNVLATRLHGRDVELARLADVIAGLRSGSGAVVVLEGAPGIGKTRLLSETRRIAERIPIRVGWADADPGERIVELGVLLRALLDGDCPLLARSELGVVPGGGESRYWLLQELESLLERAAADGPLLVCLDDLQWADGGTLAALRALTVRLGSLPIAWLLATRPVAPGADGATLLDELAARGAERLSLMPLSPVAANELAAELLRADPDLPLREMIADAGGNPFFVVELLLGLREEHLVRVSAGTARLIEPRVPDRVAAGMRRRLGRLSESARQIASAAGSLGRRFSVAELTAMLKMPTAGLVIPIEQLIEADVFAEHGNRLAFRHDLIREGVRAGTTASVRRAMDRDAVDVMLASGAVPIEVAAQLAASSDPGDEAAIDLLEQSARTVGTTDPGAGAALSRRALDLLPAGHRRTGDLVVTTTLLLHAAGDVSDAQAFAQAHLRDVLSVADESAVCLSLASMFALSPDVRAGAGRRALALRGLSDEQRGQHQSRLAYNLIQAGRPDEAAAVCEQARETIERAGDQTSRAVMTLVRGALQYIAGEFDPALAVHDEAIRVGFGAAEMTRDRVARQWRSELLATLDRYDESLAIIIAGIDAAQRERQAFVLDFFETWRGRQLFQTGQLADAGTVLEARFENAVGARVVGTLYAAGVVTLGRLAIHTGDERRKRLAMKLATGMVAAGTPATRKHGAWLLALTALSEGRVSGAQTALDAVTDEPGELLPHFPVDVCDEIELVRIAQAAEDRETTLGAVAMAEARARANPRVATIQGAAAHARGLLDGNTTSLEAATRLLAGGPRPLALASALEDLGVAQARDNDAQRAVDTLGRALIIYTDCGAAWDAARVRRRLRAQGVRRRLTASSRPANGLGALTESELTVVGLIAQGMTNREAAEQLFVSPHTVNSHLRHAFTKLGVNSRVQLATIVSARSERAPLD